MSLTDQLKQLESTISTQLDSMSESDLRRCSGTLSSIQYGINNKLQEMELREIAFIQFFLPNLTEIQFSYESAYDDEGGYYNNFSDIYLTEAPILPVQTLLKHWAYTFTDSWDQLTYLSLKSKNTAYVDSLEHPLRALFKGYIPSNPDSWNNLWTLMRSIKREQHTQAFVLLEGLLTGDEDLRTALITNYTQQPLSEMLSFNCSGWWMILFMNDSIYDAETGTIDGVDIYDLMLENCRTEYDFTFMNEPPPQIVQSMMGTVYTWIHSAMLLNKTPQEDIDALISTASDFIDLSTNT